MRRIVLLLMLTVGLVAYAPSGAAHASDPVAETAMTAAHNQLRSDKGLPRFGVHPVLVAKAQAWAANMAARNTLYHSNLADGITVGWSKLGENVGYGPDVNSIYQAFLHSPEHFANMVDPAFQWIGVGVAYGNGRMWVAVEFMNGAAPAPAPPPPAPPTMRGIAANPRGGYYVLRSDGHVRAGGGARFYGQADFGFDIARGIAVMPDGAGYAILDGYGGVHTYGSARALPRPSAYWRGWDITRGMAITSNGRGYVVIDGWGAVHASGNGPRLTPAYWRGWDIARAVAISPDNRGIYVLDGWGSVHVAGTARFHGSMYWRGWDIARGLALSHDGGGYAVLDGWGGVHPTGNAPRATRMPYVRADVWRSLTSVGSGYLAVRADGYAVHA